MEAGRKTKRAAARVPTERTACPPGAPSVSSIAAAAAVVRAAAVAETDRTPRRAASTPRWVGAMEDQGGKRPGKTADRGNRVLSSTRAPFFCFSAAVVAVEVHTVSSEIFPVAATRLPSLEAAVATGGMHSISGVVVGQEALAHS